MLLTRPKFLAPLVALALGACVHKVVYLPAPTDTPAPVVQPAPQPPPPPVEQYYEPLEVTVGRPVRERFVVQTNRPAYVAIFEVIPEEGITIVRPTSSRERYVVAGLSSVRVPWSATVISRTTASAGPRYLYAVASDEPLNISDETFRPGYLRYTLGSRVYRSSDPYHVMRALSRHFVARGIAEEEWAEDVVVVQPETTVPRIAYVYCPGGTRYEVPVEMADRVRCARPDRVGRNDPPRAGSGNGRDGSAAPDSVVGEDRRRVRPRVPTQVGRGPIDRVREPVVAGNNGRGPVTKGGVPVSEDNGRGNGNNGNAYGHANGNNGNHGNGNNGNNGNNGVGNGNGGGRENNHGNGSGNGNGRGLGDGQQSASQPVVIPATSRDSLRAEVPAAKPARPVRIQRPGINMRPQLPPPAEAQPARPVREEPAPRVENEQPKREEPQRVEPPRAEPPREEPKREEPKRVEPRPEPREEARPEPKEEAKAKDEPKPESKPDSKPEPKDEAKAEAPRPSGKPASAGDSTAARLKERVRGRVRP